MNSKTLRYAADLLTDRLAAEKIAGEAEEEFAEVVQRAVRESWTVKDARRHLSGARGARKSDAKRPCLFEQTTAKGRVRLLVHLDRMDDPEAATPDARAELASLLRGLLGRLEGGQASV